MNEIGPQRAAPSSPARVESQHRDAVKTMSEHDKRGELFADCVMREMLHAAIQRLRNASIQATSHDADNPEIQKGMMMAYQELPELTMDGWMCADISVVCEFARYALECGLSMPNAAPNERGDEIGG